MANENPMENYNQEDLHRLSVFEQQSNQLQKQIEMIQKTAQEIASLSDELEGLKGKKDSEIFAHIGRGVYAKAKLLSEDLVVDIGGKKFVKKDIDSTKELIQGQVKKLQDAEKEVNKNLEDMQKEMMEIISRSFKGWENPSSS